MCNLINIYCPNSIYDKHTHNPYDQSTLKKLKKPTCGTLTTTCLLEKMPRTQKRVDPSAGPPCYACNKSNSYRPPFKVKQLEPLKS